MSGLFSKPASPQAQAPVVPPPPPSFAEAEVKGQENADKLRRRRGMASTILSQSGTTTPTTQKLGA